MPLIACPECAASISDQAETCIYCGFPLKKLAAASAPTVSSLLEGNPNYSQPSAREPTGFLSENPNYGNPSGQDESSYYQHNRPMQQMGGPPRSGGNALSSAPMFVFAYIIFMLPSYFLPYVGSNSAIMHGMDSAAGTHALNFAFWLHMGSMLILCFLCWLRGPHIDKGWLIIFPVLATVFDFVPGLSAIPLVPTVMHLLAIILGVAGARSTA